MAENLKFPSGEFTHTELAKHNGKTNQQVWTRYQAAIKSGQIVTAGERASAGRGKPSKLWKLDPNWVAPVVPVAPATPATPPTPAPAPATPAPAASAPETDENVVLPTEAQIEAATAPAAPAPEASVTPAPVAEVTPAPEVTAPVAVVETPAAEVAATIPPVVIAEVTPAPEVIPAVEAVTPEVVTNIVAHSRANAQVADARTLEATCPVCNHPLLAINDATGVMVWCGQGIEVCSSSENPFGHGKNEREATEILNTKWTRATAAA